MMIRPITFRLLSITLSFASCVAAETQADRVFRNGTEFTADAHNSIIGYRLPFPRPNHPGYALRPHLSGKKKINFSTVFGGQAVGIKEVQDGIWLVSFKDYDLGYIDLETRVLESLENPFGPKVMLPM